VVTPRRGLFWGLGLSESSQGFGLPSTTELEARLEKVRERIAAAGVAKSVRLICVTKGFPLEMVIKMKELGVYDFGENYQQELSSKAVDEVQVRWHFIGGIQRSKLKKITEVAYAIHSVSRMSELHDLANLDYRGEVFLQLRSDDVAGRNGFERSELESAVKLCKELHINLVGLMGVASLTSGHRAPEFFRLLRDLSDGFGLKRCSMGMSDDFELALEYGATDLRLGRVLLGPRPNPKAA
jgi:uncharacterized pyridoxal phosphate-containing UPF0001 family protein